MADAKINREKPVKVVALARGYYGGRIREPGEVFMYDLAKLGSWMEETDLPLAAPGEQRGAWVDPNVTTAAQAEAAKSKAKN